jgi:phage replication O-like protein O
MASPQRENGYTGIANEILDKLAAIQLNGTQFRIIMVVFRYTYGFQRKEHELSETFISKATGIHKQQIKRELKTLIDKNIIKIEREATFEKPRLISFNKNYEDWLDKLISLEVAKTIPGSEMDTTTGSELDTSPGSELDTQERKLKENSKENIYIVFSHWNQKKIITHKTLTDKISSHINARLKEGYEVRELLTAIDNYAEVLKNDKYYWSYKWGLNDFLLRGLDKFKDESEPLINFLKQKPNGGVQNGYGRSNGVLGEKAPRERKIQPVNFLNQKL